MFLLIDYISKELINIEQLCNKSLLLKDSNEKSSKKFKYIVICRRTNGFNRGNESN